MQSVTLSPELTSVLAAEAERSGKTISALAEEWLRQQHQVVREKQLAEQSKQFMQQRAELYRRYPDQYVAFYNGDVLDHDVDMRALALRVQTEYPGLPVVIAQVTPKPVTGYRMRSPRLEQNSS